MSYIHSNNPSNLEHNDVGYVIQKPDDFVHWEHLEEEYYDKTESDGRYYEKTTADNKYLHLNGSKAMISDLDMGSNKITNVVDPSTAKDAMTKNFADSNFLMTSGNNAMSGNLDAGSNKIINCNDPTNSKDVVNLQYLNNNSGSDSVKIKEVTDVQSSTLSQNGAISHSKQVTGLTDQQYLCRIQLIVWGNFSGNYTYLQHLLQDDGFTDQYDPIKQTQQSNSNVSRFQLQNGGEVGRENQQTSIYNFTLLTNTTQQITFNTDVIDDGGLSSDTTVHTKLHVFITPASIL